MQNKVLSIQLAHAKVGVFPGSTPGAMPSMGGMLMPPSPTADVAWDGGLPRQGRGLLPPCSRVCRLGGLGWSPWRSTYVAAARVAAFDKNVLLVAQDEFPQATNMDALKAMQVNPALTCKCCGLKGHQVDSCGFTGHAPGEYLGS